MTFDKKILKNYPIFGGFSDKNLECLEKYFNYCEFFQGDIIIKEGSPNDKLYFILEGDVGVLKNNKQSSLQHHICSLHKGDNFGEMELIDISPSIASIQVESPLLKIICLQNRDLFKIEQEDAEIFIILIMNLAREISRRLRKADQTLAEKQMEK